MMNLSASIDFAHRLDSQDPLASYRAQFVASDPDLIYLDGNSLGRLPRSVIERMKRAVEEEWGADLIRGWNKGWWESPSRIGDQIATLLGAAQGQVLVGDQTSINLFKLATAALTLHPQRKRIITDSFNVPSDLYILQGIKDLLGELLAVWGDRLQVLEGPQEDSQTFLAPHGVVDGLLERHAAFAHATTDQLLRVGVQRDRRAHRCIIASRKLML